MKLQYAGIIKELFFTRQYRECLHVCQQVLGSTPEKSLPWKYAGKSLLALGEFNKAQQYLAESHRLDAYDPETAKDLGNMYLNLNSTENAAKWFKKSLEIDNDYAPALNNLAYLEKQNGKNLEADYLFKKAMKADPKLEQAYTGAAANLLILEDLNQAELFAKQACRINAKTPNANEILGIIFQKRKNYQRAIESYLKELSINPKANTSLLNLGLLFLHEGKTTESIELLSRAAMINSSDQCSFLLAKAYEKIGKTKEAIAEYKKIDISKSHDKMISFNFGLCLLNAGNNIAAIEAFKNTIKLDKTFTTAWSNIDV